MIIKNLFLSITLWFFQYIKLFSENDVIGMRDSVRDCAKWAREKARGPGARGPRPPGAKGCRLTICKWPVV